MKGEKLLTFVVFLLTIDRGPFDYGHNFFYMLCRRLGILPTEQTTCKHGRSIPPYRYHRQFHALYMKAKVGSMLEGRGVFQCKKIKRRKTTTLQKCNILL